MIPIYSLVWALKEFLLNMKRPFNVQRSLFDLPFSWKSKVRNERNGILIANSCFKPTACYRKATSLLSIN